MSSEADTQFLKYAGLQLPRYTSYPTAPHFSAMTPQVYECWINEIAAEEDISLYVHVPYCKQLCWFCGCHTQITQKYAPVDKYLELLNAEIALLRQKLGRKQKVSHLHFGGGSPTIISPPDFLQLVEVIRERFSLSKDAELAIEVDPRTVTEAHLAAYARSGINRVSLGVQDFDGEVQKAVNRVQPLNLVYRVTQLCRDYGITSINMDLIYGLPGQSLESIQKTIDYTIMLKPERISLFGYAHVPWKKKNISLIPIETLPDEQQRIAFFALASSMLHDAGYIQIGLDHFVLPQDSMAKAFTERKLHRNFQGYTTDTASTLIGLGTSAISRFRQGYAQNTSALPEYERALEHGVFAVKKGFTMQEEDRLRSRVIESLMCYFDTDIAKCCLDEGFPADHFDNALHELQTSIDMRYVTLTDRRVSINTEYSQIVRMVCSYFDAYYASGAGRHAKMA